MQSYTLNARLAGKVLPPSRPDKALSAPRAILNACSFPFPQKETTSDEGDRSMRRTKASFSKLGTLRFLDSSVQGARPRSRAGYRCVIKSLKSFQSSSPGSLVHALTKDIQEGLQLLEKQGGTTVFSQSLRSIHNS